MLLDNSIKMYSTHNEGKSVVAERFIKTLYDSHLNFFYVLDDIVDECNNTYHRTIKMKPIDLKSDSFTEYNEESNEK